MTILFAASPGSASQTLRKNLEAILGSKSKNFKSGAGIDSGDLDEGEVAELFGKCKGFKTHEPNVSAAPAEEVDDDDF